MQDQQQTAGAKTIVVTGDRPTGPLHLGHYVGSLKKRLELQEGCRQFVLVADAQALTDNAGNPAKIARNIPEVMADYLAIGLDPAKTTFCLQSEIPALAEISSYLMNLVTVSRLERNPTVRDEIRQRGFERSIPTGFFTYPVSQAADITAFDAELVPVGADQLPVIEQAQEIVDRFNESFGETLVRPEALLSGTGRLPGIDGAGKMGKSTGNAIPLSASADDIVRAVRMMFTDPGHIRASDPGTVEGNVVFTYLDAFDPDQTEVERLKTHYQQGGLGDMVLKRRLMDILEAEMAPIRARRERLVADPGYLIEILRQGTRLANEIAAATAGRVKRRMGLGFPDLQKQGPFGP